MNNCANDERERKKTRIKRRKNAKKWRRIAKTCATIQHTPCQKLVATEKSTSNWRVPFHDKILWPHAVVDKNGG